MGVILSKHEKSRQICKNVAHYHLLTYFYYSIVDDVHISIDIK